MALLIWLACSQGMPADTDRQLYLELIDRRPPSQADLDRCGELRSEALAGDCALVVATRAAQAEQADPGTYCDRVPAGAWRDECWFVAAEQHVQLGRTGDAVDHCRRSGAFAQRCVFHAWQRDVMRIARDTPDPERAAQRGRPLVGLWARRVGDDWRPPRDAGLPLGAGGDTFEDAFWSTLFRAVFEHEERPDPSPCDALEEREACRVGVTDVVVRRALDQRRRGLVDCAVPDEPAAAHAYWEARHVAFAPDPHLLASLRAMCTRP